MSLSGLANWSLVLHHEEIKIKSFQYPKGWIKEVNLGCSAPSEQCLWDCFLVLVVFFCCCLFFCLFFKVTLLSLLLLLFQWRKEKEITKSTSGGGNGMKKYAVQVGKYNFMARLGQRSLLFNNTTPSKHYWAFIFFLVPLLQSLILYFTRTSA